MVLDVTIAEDGEVAAYIVATRLQPPEGDPDPDADDVCVWAWSVEAGDRQVSSVDRGTVEHRPREGTLALLAAIAARAA